MTALLKYTIGNEKWFRENEAKLRGLFPTNFTPIDQTMLLRAGFALKLLGVNWRSVDELTKIFAYFAAIGVVEILDGKLLRRKP